MTKAVLRIGGFVFTAWFALLVVRLCGGVAWSWLWLLAPAWIVGLLLAALLAFAAALEYGGRAWAWLRAVRDARRRSRYWRQVQVEGLRGLVAQKKAAGERTFLIEREIALRDRADVSEPARCKPAFRRIP